jgi:hypothetical protein
MTIAREKYAKSEALLKQDYTLTPPYEGDASAAAIFSSGKIIVRFS